MIAASTPRQAQVRIMAPVFCAISGSNKASRGARSGLSYRAQKQKVGGGKSYSDNAPAGEKREAPGYGHPIRSMRKAASNQFKVATPRAPGRRACWGLD